MKLNSMIIKASFSAFLFVAVSGCASRWCPTDPRLDVPNEDERIVVDSWNMTVEADFNTGTK